MPDTQRGCYNKPKKGRVQHGNIKTFLKGIDVSVGEDTSILSYDDFTEISQYAIPSIQWAVGAGLIGSENNKLEPQSNVARAEAATILMRYIESIDK